MTTGGFIIGLDILPTVTFWNIDLLAFDYYFMQEKEKPCMTMGYTSEFATISVDISLTLPGCWLSFYDLLDIQDYGDCHQSSDSVIEGIWSKSFAPSNLQDRSGSYGYNTCNGAEETEIPSITDIIDATIPETTDTTTVN